MSTQPTSNTDKREYIRWTKDEWESIALRAADMKKNNPDMPWTRIVVVCQDDIDPSRRKTSVNGVYGLKPMFDILHLDEKGNPFKPAVVTPAAPAATPPPAPAAVTTEVPPTVLSAYSTVSLLAELFSRGSALKLDLDKLHTLEKNVTSTQSAIMEQLEMVMKRVDAAEKAVLEGLDTMDRAKTAYEQMTTNANRLADMIDKINTPTAVTPLDNLAAAAAATMKSTASTASPVDTKPATMAKPRFLIFGIHDKDIAHIKSKLTRNCQNCEIVAGVNHHSFVLPKSIDYVLISGHPTFNHRWTESRATYGDKKVRRIENGSLTSYAREIERLMLFGS